jgi:squalene-hopene/tetraprenyl-beta-curcumene cyclase
LRRSLTSRLARTILSNMKFIGAVFVPAFVAVIGSSAVAASTGSGWDEAAAARYLDDRMDMWFQNADKLQTGKGSASCISCHTVVPYAMARPILRKSLRENTPTPQETRLLDEVVRRVDTYGSHEPFYSSSEKESQGVESVVNLLILAGEDSRSDRHDASDATRKANQEFWKQQRPDGAWNWFDFSNEPWEAANSVYYGAALAAIAEGTYQGLAISSDQETTNHLARLRSYLNEKFPEQNLYDQAWMLLASSRLEGLLSREESGALMTRLISKQNDDGGWSLYALGSWTWSKSSPPFTPKSKIDSLVLSRSDGYATGFLAYALREAGLPANDPVLTRATDWLKANQKECQIDSNHWKCWRTYSLNYDREHSEGRGEPWRRMFMSDAATAFAVLALLPSE